MLTEITILDLDAQPIQVRAKQDGYLAIHVTYPVPGEDGIGFFTITHVPTGRALCVTETLPNGLQALRELQALAVDWSLSELAACNHAYRPFVVPLTRSLFDRGVTVWPSH